MGISTGDTYTGTDQRPRASNQNLVTRVTLLRPWALQPKPARLSPLGLRTLQNTALLKPLRALRESFNSSAFLRLVLDPR